MKTREDLIARVLKNLGVLAAGQAPSDEDRAEIDDLIEPVCAKLLDDGVAKLTGDEIEDAAYLPLADIVAEAALVPFGISGGTWGQMLMAKAEQARADLKLAYRVYDARPPMRADRSWGRRAASGWGCSPAPVSPSAPVAVPTSPVAVNVVVDGGREG